jgi:uncharacterized protein with HEPN domain
MPFDAAAVRRWLDDIHHHIFLAERFADGMDYDALRDDLRTTYAVTRCPEIISEASRRLPDELKARHPSIQWRDMAAAGNSIATNMKMWQCASIAIHQRRSSMTGAATIRPRAFLRLTKRPELPRRDFCNLFSFVIQSHQGILERAAPRASRFHKKPKSASLTKPGGAGFLSMRCSKGL